MPEFTLSIGGEEPAEGGLDLGLNFGAEPSLTEAVAPPKKAAPAKAVPASQGGRTAHARESDCPSQDGGTARRVRIQPRRRAASRGGSGPRLELRRGTFVDGPQAGPPLPRLSAKAAAPPPPPVEVPAAVPEFALDFGGEQADTGGMNLGLNFGPEPSLTAAKPSPKKVAPPPPPPAQTAPVEEEEEEDEDEEEETATKPRLKLDRRVLIGAGAAVLLIAAVGGAFALGMFGGKGKAAKIAGNYREAVEDQAESGRGGTYHDQTEGDHRQERRGHQDTLIGRAADPGRGRVRRPDAQRQGVCEPDLNSAMQARSAATAGACSTTASRSNWWATTRRSTSRAASCSSVPRRACSPCWRLRSRGKTRSSRSCSESPLSMSGVTIVVHYTGLNPNQDAPPVIFAGDRVALDRCTFKVVGGAKGSRRSPAKGAG